jgi:hypothetical protein
MISLHDFIGALLTSVNNASAISSASTVRLAEQYQGNTMLRNFPVPMGAIEHLEITTKCAFVESPSKIQVSESDAKVFVDATRELATQLPVTAGFENFFASSPIREKIWSMFVPTLCEQLFAAISGGTFGSTAELAMTLAEFLGDALVRHQVDVDRHAAATAALAATPTDVSGPTPESTASITAAQSQTLLSRLQKIVSTHPPTSLQTPTAESAIQVIVANSDLTHLPPELISNLTIKIGMSYRKSVSVEVNGNVVKSLDTY